MRRVVHGLGAVGALVIALVAVPWALLAASERRLGDRNPIGGVRPPWSWASSDVGDAVRRPLEDDTVVDLIVRGCLVAAWVAVGVVVATTGLELLHLVRHRDVRSPQRRGLGWAQPIARFIASGLLALLPVSITASTTQSLAPLLAPQPMPTGVDGAPAAGSDVGAGEPTGRSREGPARWSPPGWVETGDPVHRHAAFGPTAPVSLRTEAAPPAAPPQDGRVHVVTRGESVWSIAAAITGGDDVETVRLADAILDLNLGREMVDGTTFSSPALIRPGWELLVPSDSGPARPPTDPSIAVPSTEHTAQLDVGEYTVREGDTLSGIARAELGDAAAWPAIADRNLGRTMNDGRVFDDPHLILPGWDLELDITPAEIGTPTPQYPPGGHEETSEADEAEHSPQADERESYDVTPQAQPGSVDAPQGAPVDDGDGRTPDRETDWFDDRRDDDTQTPGTIQTSGPEASDQATASVPPPVTVSTPTPATELGPGPTVDHAETADAPATSMPDTGTIAAPPSSTSTTVAPVGFDSSDSTPSSLDGAPESSPSSPLGVEHAAMLAGGLLTLAAVRRRRRLRAARPRSRIPAPAPDVAATERALRTVGGAERRARVDVAIRALARQLVGSGVQPVVLLHRADGAIDVVLAAPAQLAAPWMSRISRTADPSSEWTLPASIPVELLADDARAVGDPCPALVAVGRTDDAEVLVDLEAAGVVAIDAPADVADQVLAAIASTTATSLTAETAHLIAVGVDERLLFEHPNTSTACDGATALEQATALVGGTLDSDAGTFDLRARRTGGEAWEPALVFVGASAAAEVPWAAVPERGRGVAVVAATASAAPSDGVRLRADGPAWRLEAPGWNTEFIPFGLADDEIERLVTFVDEADATAASPQLDDRSPDDDADRIGPAHHPDGTDGDDDVEGETVDLELNGAPEGHGAAEDGQGAPAAAAAAAAAAIIVRVLGGVSITDPDGTTHGWQRSKTVELIAWMATHRHRSTRTAARTAMWEHDVRDATFSNVVSEARRGLATLVAPPDGEEWIPRTMTDDLPLHPAVMTDVDVIERALAAARVAAPDQAIEVLRPVVAVIDGLPFADTDYLWADADGLVTTAILTATTACVELAEHALSLGDIETVFMATTHGLQVLPGHEQSIALRMRAHARRGDLAGVRQEWESYERVITADAWSDGEPAPELLRLRRELLAH